MAGGGKDDRSLPGSAFLAQSCFLAQRPVREGQPRPVPEGQDGRGRLPRPPGRCCFCFGLGLCLCRGSNSLIVSALQCQRPNPLLSPCDIPEPHHDNMAHIRLLCSHIQYVGSVTLRRTTGQVLHRVLQGGLSVEFCLNVRLHREDALLNCNRDVVQILKMRTHHGHARHHVQQKLTEPWVPWTSNRANSSRQSCSGAGQNSIA